MRVFRSVFGWLVALIALYLLVSSVISLFTEGFWAFIIGILMALVVAAVAGMIFPDETGTMKTAHKNGKPKTTTRTDIKIPDELTKRQLKAFNKLAENILDDDFVSESEARQLQIWFDRNPAGENDYKTLVLHTTLYAALLDDVFDADEEFEINTLLTEFIQDYEDEFGEEQTYIPEFETDTSFRLDVNDLENGGEYGMIYEDSKGNISERPIIFRSLTTKNERQYMTAICLKRKGVRTFRVDRIQNLVSLETGEILVDD